MSHNIFALDIGTQTVTGVILKEVNNRFSVVDYCLKHHNERAMVDGQIHDVVKVAKVIKDVKSTLEAKHGQLHNVRVAAAGRSLKTVQGKAKLPIHKQPITDRETIRFLELSAVQQAQKSLVEKGQENNHQDYYCVGYSVLHYRLDGDSIGSLIDQTGEEASVEIIATFLPQVVVESLLASLQRADLTMEALTLEPIAAINVLVPESMRRLNIALVDIGAGTSDIAITKDGTVIAYGMVAQAGDEMTEAISNEFLLDFDIAEQVKREVVTEGIAKTQDILGFTKQITLKEINEALSKPLEVLTDDLTEKILTLNQKAPQAVMLIGGGSLTPNLGKRLAEKLQLPENRIALRTVEAIQNVDNLSIIPKGPDFITPLGIAITSIHHPIKYTSVTINNRPFRLFETEKLTIGDCLVHVGVSLEKLYGTPGLAYMISFNGKNITLPGSHGKPPTLRKNGERATIDDFISNGDHIEYQKGANGEEPTVSLKELVDDLTPLTITVNQKQYTFHPRYIVNGKEKDEHYIVKDKDTILVDYPETVKDVLQRIDEDLTLASFPIYVDGKLINLKKGQTSIELNHQKVSLLAKVKPNDHLVITYAKQPVVKDVLEEIGETSTTQITVTFNGKPVTLKKKTLTVIRKSSPLTEDTPILPNDSLTLEQKEDITFIFQDVFRYVDIDTINIHSDYELKINGEKATFFDQIFDGDKLILQ